MTSRPKVVAFDIIGTVFSLEPLRGPIEGLGLPPCALEMWFAAGLRDTFALAAAETFRPFQLVLKAALEGIMIQHCIKVSTESLQSILEEMTRLPPHSDAQEALRILSGARMRIFALSNGAQALTVQLLKRADLHTFFERIVSVDEIGHFKPRSEVYLHAARVAKAEPRELMLVATHAWDVHGARRAGLSAAFVSRGQAYPDVMETPDIQQETLADTARSIVAIGT